jgi:hypothetical protein
MNRRIQLTYTFSVLRAMCRTRISLRTRSNSFAFPLGTVNDCKLLPMILILLGLKQ